MSQEYTLPVVQEDCSIAAGKAVQEIIEDLTLGKNETTKNWFGLDVFVLFQIQNVSACSYSYK